MAAPRLCPRCGTPVDERRARGLPYCLQCGAPLGSGFGMKAANVGEPARAGGTSPLVWILLGGGIFIVVVGLGVVAFLVLVVRSAPEPTAIAAADDAGPVVNLENKDEDAGTAPKPKPKPTGTPAPTVAVTAPTSTSTVSVSTKPPFNRSRANSEVDRVIAGAQSCHRTGDPTGTGSIRVDFEPDGRVGTLSRPPFGTTATGACISARMRAINIGPFDGTRAQSVEATFIIRDTNPAPSATPTPTKPPPPRDAGR
jgi:hypothetical protein